MKKQCLLILFLLMLGGAGCVFEAPVYDQHLPPDAVLYGSWIEKDASPADHAARMVIFPDRDQGYFVHAPIAVDDGIYYRGERVAEGLIQLCVLGASKEVLAPNAKKKRYTLVRYRVESDQLILQYYSPDNTFSSPGDVRKKLEAEGLNGLLWKGEERYIRTVRK